MCPAARSMRSCPGWEQHDDQGGEQQVIDLPGQRRLLARVGQLRCRFRRPAATQARPGADQREAAERKSGKVAAKEAAETVIAFANGEGGVLVVGASNGVVDGVTQSCSTICSCSLSTKPSARTGSSRDPRCRDWQHNEPSRDHPSRHRRPGCPRNESRQGVPSRR